MTTACWGGYNLTRNIYNWNANVSDSKWVVWLIHLPVLIVSGFVIMADGFLFNTVEFWSGNNPINLGDARKFQGPDGVVAHVTPSGEGFFDVVVEETNGATHDVVLQRDAEAVRLYDGTGRLIAQKPL